MKSRHSLALVMVLLLVAASVFADGGFQKMTWGMSPQEMLEFYPDLEVVQVYDTAATYTMGSVVAGYVCTIYAIVFLEEGLQSVWIEFTGEFDERSLVRLIDAKYVEQENNFWDYRRWVNPGIVNTIVVLETPLSGPQVLKYYSPLLWRVLEAAKADEL